MGWDITAWVEVRPRWVKDEPGGEPWSLAVEASILLDRNYDAFGCLFGVMNEGHFEPVVTERDLPTNVSERVAAEAMACLDDSPEHGFLSPSWITWAELEKVDWDMPALRADQRLHQYVRDESGAWQYDGKASWSSALGQATGQSISEALSGEAAPWPEGKEWVVGDRLFRAVRLTRRDAITEQWWSLFAIMRELAKQFTPEGVRLVVWFDR